MNRNENMYVFANYQLVFQVFDIITPELRPISHYDILTNTLYDTFV